MAATSVSKDKKHVRPERKVRYVMWTMCRGNKTNNGFGNGKVKAN